MWTCPICAQEFVGQNSIHSCAEKTIDDFLYKKSETTRRLFHFFVKEYMEYGDIKLHPARTRISFASRIRFAYIHRLGKNYVDVVLQLNRNAEDNLCFYKIAKVPDINIWNHYFRLEDEEDLNEEVMRFMHEAFDRARK